MTEPHRATDRSSSGKSRQQTRMPSGSVPSSIEPTLFEEALNNATDAIGMSTPEGMHYYQNTAFDALFGDLRGRYPASTYCDAAVCDDVFRTIMAGKQWTGQVRMNARDGRIIDVNLRAYASKNARGRILSVVGIHTLMTDFPERQRMEAALRESESRYRETLSNIDDNVWRYELDAHGGFVDSYNSKAIERMLALPDGAIGHDFDRFFEHVHPDDVAVLRTELAALIAAPGNQRSIEYRMRKGDGTLIWVRSRGTAYPRPSGHIIAFGTTTDITARRLMETQLKTLNERLETLVAKRTARLRAMAMELTGAEQRERRRIAHVLHEDLQQRLVGIQYGVSTLATTGALSANAAAQVRKELADAIAVSRDLTVRLCPPALYELGLIAALELQACQLKNRFGLTVTLQAKDPFHVESEEIRLFVFGAVNELLMNIVKHAGVHQAHVRLRQPSPRRQSVEVADQGRGFDADQLHHASTFGLFSIRERIEALGGRLDIDSQPGKGTVATLSWTTTPER